MAQPSSALDQERNRVVQTARRLQVENRRRQHTERSATAEQTWVCYPIVDVEQAFWDALGAVEATRRFDAGRLLELFDAVERHLLVGPGYREDPQREGKALLARLDDAHRHWQEAREYLVAYAAERAGGGV